MKKGFTIVELMMVIGIIVILMGIVTTAASTSIKSSRSRKSEVLRRLVQTGIATYYEQKGEWPWGAGLPSGKQADGAGNNKDPESIELSATEVRTCVMKLIDEAKRNNPMMDISGLFVSRSPGERDSGPALGLNFPDALRGTKQSQKMMKPAQMYFGYPEKEHGWFRRFKMVYSIPGDSLTVMEQEADSK